MPGGTVAASAVKPGVEDKKSDVDDAYARDEPTMNREPDAPNPRAEQR